MQADLAAMQADTLAQILYIRARSEIHDGGLASLRDQISGLAAQNEQLLAEHATLRETIGALKSEQVQLRLTLQQLQVQHDGLRASLDRLDLFDQTATAVENGLLSLALLKKADHGQPSMGS